MDLSTRASENNNLSSMKNPVRGILNWYFSRNSLPYWCLLLVDTMTVLVCVLFTYWIFRKTQVIFDNRFEVLYTAIAYSLLSWVGARLFRTYSGVVRYSSFIDLLHVAFANVVSVVLCLILSYSMDALHVDALSALTQTETVVAFFIATLVMWGVRVLVKTLHDVTLQRDRAIRVLIYGALSGGVGLAKNIRSQRPQRFRLCGFISHDKRAKHMLLMGEKVYNIDDNLLEVIKEKRIEAVLVSPLRSSEFRNNQDIQDMLINAGVRIFMAQQVKEASLEDNDLTDEEIKNMQMREVSVEDLLPRQEIVVDLESVAAQLWGKRILVTGSAGSIGSELVRQIAEFQPAKMMLIDQAETPQHDIRLMMAKDFPNVDAEAIVTSISRQRRMEEVFRTFRPDYVFHAAAYKHVPMMEDNPSEAVLNNIYGTKVIADFSVKYGVKKFVMVSTDKAVNPTNVMGCSKRICEIYVQSLNNSQQTTQFVTTRFGNVLGSNGSVIPLFREQIKNGGPVTVTDERIVRFFMLIPEACKLVLEAGTKGHGGEIFVFDMGQPVKIADLARRMIMLSGAKNVEIKFTGLRPGEKLYEEVLNELEGTKPSFHNKIRIAEVREYDFAEVSKEVDELIEISKQYDDMATVKMMKDIVPEFKSNNSIYEQLDK
jgi:FlaA1/EpsC-like NDP-sugar epimerase